MGEPRQPKDDKAGPRVDEAISAERSGSDPGPVITAKHFAVDGTAPCDPIEDSSSYEALFDLCSETRAAITQDDLTAADGELSRHAARLQPLPILLAAYLVFSDRRIRLTKSLTIIGRVEEVADLALPDDDQVSRHHAAVVYSNGEFWIEDLDSTNGTFLKGRRIKRAALEPGAEVRVGRRAFRLVLSK